MPPIPLPGDVACRTIAAPLKRSAGFSLIELTIVLVIVGVVAAIAVPRFSRGSKAAADAALAEKLQTVRQAVEVYHAEHGRYPSLAAIQEQLTHYTDAAGNVFPAKSRPDLLGPYLRAFPSRKDRARAKVAATAASNVDWVYNEATGDIRATANGADDTGKPYAAY